VTTAVQKLPMCSGSAVDADRMPTLQDQPWSQPRAGMGDESADQAGAGVEYVSANTVSVGQRLNDSLSLAAYKR
jgi:hypothetical protein